MVILTQQLPTCGGACAGVSVILLHASNPRARPVENPPHTAAKFKGEHLERHELILRRGRRQLRVARHDSLLRCRRLASCVHGFRAVRLALAGQVPLSLRPLPSALSPCSVCSHSASPDVPAARARKYLAYLSTSPSRHTFGSQLVHQQRW